ncbi:MAG: TIGR04255 family protein [Methanobrevibacter sp.]|nr:TIGR04255 family protein [Methanobrevibacter sp.]
MIFNFGQHHTEYPNPIARKEFILDFNCNTDESMHLSEINEIIKEMNDINQELFEESIGEKLKKYMSSEKNDWS